MLEIDFDAVPLDWKEFDLPKKTGGKRHICAPNEELKKAQRKIKEFLEEMGETCDELKPTVFAHGFVCGRDTTTGLHMHDWRTPTFVCSDVQDFFDNMPVALVRDRLYKAGLLPSLVDNIMRLCTYQGRFPQGSPCSPLFMNIGMRDCDYMIAAFAKRHGYKYSRYADDMTFSRDPMLDTGAYVNPWHLLAGANCILKSHTGMQLNPGKSHVIEMRRSTKQRVNGITVSQDGCSLNGPWRMRAKARAMVHNLYLHMKSGASPRSNYGRWSAVKGYVVYLDHLRHASRSDDSKSGDPRINAQEWAYLTGIFDDGKQARRQERKRTGAAGAAGGRRYAK